MENVRKSGAAAELPARHLESGKRDQVVDGPIACARNGILKTGSSTMMSFPALMVAAQLFRVVEQFGGALFPGALPPLFSARSMVPPQEPGSWTIHPNPPSTAAPEGP